MNDDELIKLEEQLRQAHEERFRSLPTDRTWYDQRHAVYTFRWTRVARWAERGVFGRMMIPKNAVVTDLGCGDGFFDYHFFAEHASVIHCVDHDESALAQGARLHPDPKLHWARADLLAYEVQPSDTIFTFGVLEEFNELQTDALLLKVRNALKPDGIFGGSTILDASGQGHHQRHRRFFKDAPELASLMNQHFKNVTIWTADCLGRTDAYWRCQQ